MATETEWTVERVEELLAKRPEISLSRILTLDSAVRFLLNDRTQLWGEAIAETEKVRLKLWHEYTDSQAVLLNMVMREVKDALEAARDHKGE